VWCAGECVCVFVGECVCVFVGGCVVRRGGEGREGEGRPTASLILFERNQSLAI
jgi:hypothetical protein